MSKFKLRIYQGNNNDCSAKWLKQDQLENWRNYQHFFCDGNESIISLDIGELWHTMIKTKQTHFEQGVLGDERIMAGKYATTENVRFYVEIDIVN